MDELEMQKTFTDEETTKEFVKNKKTFTATPTYFRLVDLSRWLENSKNFKVQRVWIVQRLKDIGGTNITVSVRKIQTRAWVIPSFEKSMVEIPTPTTIKNNKIKKEDEILGGENMDDLDLTL